MGIHKFLFQGAPGTGKTEAVKQLARILNREIFMVDFSAIVDSKLEMCLRDRNKDVYMVALRDEGELIGYYEKHEYRNAETMKPYDLW